ncbi:MAG: ATP-binding protein [Chloroflexi bacterium]|nr:ATP-binding protein [Chloroflexota bacterium]
MRRAMNAGVLGGLLISLGGTYPFLVLLMPLILPDWQRPIQNEAVHTIVLMVSAVILLPSILGLGVQAARLSRAQGWAAGAKAGMLAGLFAGLISYITLILPFISMRAYRIIIPYYEHAADEITAVIPYLDQYGAIFENSSYLMELALLIAVLFWGAQGAFIGWRRRHKEAEKRPSLYQLYHTKRHPKAWFKGDETAVHAGLLVGLIIGFLLIFLAFGSIARASSPVEWINAIDMSAGSMVVDETQPLTIATFLWPLVTIGLLAFGLFVVIVMKNPPNLFLSRWRGITIAGVIISGFLYSLIEQMAFFTVGISPFLVQRGMMVASLTDPDIVQTDFENFQAFVDLVFSGQSGSLSLMYFTILLPWLVLLLAVITGVVLGGMQTLIFGTMAPMMHKRSVDKAAALQRRINREPDNVLPLLYGLFQRETAAYDILAHIAVRSYKKAPALSQIASALHTLGSSHQPFEYKHAIDGVQTALSEHTSWRWQSDISCVYVALDEILAAKNLEQILKITPPPTQQTSSLPPAMVKSVDLISNIVEELHIVEKVDNLSAKLIFLENALQAIYAAQRYVNVELERPTNTVTVLPETAALHEVLSHWQSVVLNTIQHLKGRAELVCSLQNKQHDFVPQLPIILEVANQGLNVAQQVQVKLLSGTDYYLNGGSENQIEILSPGEARQVEMLVSPVAGAQRIRVAWQVTYDDAVDSSRTLEFADVVEFVTPDKPFERIFPIPYVTGTPLKTDDVFVGRDDVFTFIQENLVGAYQNNVIILHGQRRTGKTSVLYRLGEVMANTHYGVLIDMQGKPARSEADFLYAIADDITFALEDHDIEVDLPPRSAFEEEGPEFFFRSRFIRSLIPHLGDKHLLLMFDEFEELQRRVEDGRLQPEIFQFLRNLMQHEKQVDFVFSGTHKLEELGAEYWSVLFNIAAYKPITFLSPNELHKLIHEPVADYGVEYDPLSIDRIIGVTAGHPYFAQLVLHEMIVYHNETQRNYLTVSDVNRVLERIVERGEAHFKYIWAESSEEERLVLRALTELLVGSDSVNVNKMHDYLSERGYQSADNWQQALSGVEGRDILTRASAKSPLYRFKVDLIRFWIDHTRSQL